MGVARANIPKASILRRGHGASARRQAEGQAVAGRNDQSRRRTQASHSRQTLSATGLATSLQTAAAELARRTSRAPLRKLRRTSTASQLRNHSSWFTLLDAAVGVAGMKRELVLGERWLHLKTPTTFVWVREIDGRMYKRQRRWSRSTRAPASSASQMLDTYRWFDQPQEMATAVAAALGR